MTFYERRRLKRESEGYCPSEKYERHKVKASGKPRRRLKKVPGRHTSGPQGDGSVTRAVREVVERHDDWSDSDWAAEFRDEVRSVARCLPARTFDL